MLIYHIADVHIGVINRRLKDKLFEIQYEHLKNLYEKATLENADFVIIAGDLFDSNSIPSEIAKKVLELFKEYSDIHTVIIPGGGAEYEGEITGHDAYTTDSIYRRPDISIYFDSDNLHLLTPQKPVITINDTSFHAGFFEIPTFTETGAKYNIAIIHGAFGKGEEEIDPKELENSPFDYIALGHYHKHRIFKKAAYPGAFIQFEFTKAKELSSGYIRATLDKEIKIEFIPFADAPEFKRVQILSEWDIKELKKNLKDHTFIEIEGYLKELEEKISELVKRPGVTLREDAFVIEENSTMEILFSALKKAIYENPDIPDEFKEDVFSFIIRFLRKKPTYPNVKQYLARKYDL